MRRHRRFDWFDLKTGESVTSCVRRARGFDQFDLKTGEIDLIGLCLKTGDGFDAVKVWAEGTWRHREAYVEAKRSRRGGPFVRCSYKNIDCFAYTRAVSVINSVVVFLSFGGGLNDQMEG